MAHEPIHTDEQEEGLSVKSSTNSGFVDVLHLMKKALPMDSKWPHR